MLTFPCILGRGLVRRCGVIALLAYQFLFLNVIVPGHTRGAITLDGKHSGDCPMCCCCGDAPANDQGKPDSKQHAPSEKDKESCAICNFAARVMPATFVDLKLGELRFVELMPVTGAHVAASLDFIPTYLGRGPPAAA
jgi:hypothetical protein